MIEFLKELDMKIKIILGIFAILSIVTGGITGFYKTFAKETPFQAHLAMHEHDKDEARRKELREIVYECKIRYGVGYEKAPDDFTIEFCVDAEIELEGLTETSNKGG